MTTSTPTTTRTVRVTAGDRDYVWFNATDTTAQDLTGSTVVVGFGTWYDTPTAAITPNGASDVVQVLPVTQPDGSVTQSHLRVGLFIAATTGSDGAHVIAPASTKYGAWIKVSDSPSVSWVRCGPVEII
jgi:hypothetical protein